MVFNIRTALAVLSSAVLMVPASAVGAQAATPDRTRPQASFTTQDGAVLVGPSYVTGQSITGKVTDNRRVREVWIEMYSSTDTPVFGYGMAMIGNAMLRCRNERRACTWEMEVPPEPGEWDVRALAVDAAGNRRWSKRLTITVVTPPTYLPI